MTTKAAKAAKTANFYAYGPGDLDSVLAILAGPQSSGLIEISWETEWLGSVT
jgi:hypothetical protein